MKEIETFNILRHSRSCCRGGQKVNCPQGKRSHPGVLALRRYYDCLHKPDEQCSPLQRLEEINMAISVLIVEDDRNIQELLQLYLEKEGYAVTVASDGGQGLAKFRAIKPDLVLLDVMMPVMDGWAVCKAIRADSQTPIIMLTAKGETDDKVSGLKSGADDYVTKPFEMKELLARIEAVLRRTGGTPAQESSRRLCFDKMTIDMDAFELIIDGKKVDTPPKEMELLFYLASSPNRVYTRNQLLDEVWGFDYFGDSRTVDVHVKRLRGKLEGVSESWNLKTVWGVGYKFEVL